VPLQAVLQQTPSTQLPLAHWFAVAQTEPLAWSAAQVPVDVQYDVDGLVQSATVAQLVPHALDDLHA
jgi:hypothetical protein